MSMPKISTVGERPILGMIAISLGVLWLYSLWPLPFKELGAFFSFDRNVRDKSSLFVIIISVSLILFGAYELYGAARNKNP